MTLGIKADGGASRIDDARVYHAQAASWSDEINRTNERAAKLWMKIAIALAVLLGLALFALASLAPFKEIQPFVITVNETTGRIEAARTPQSGTIEQDEAVAQANIAQYVIARETYDPFDSRQRFDLVMLMSDGQAQTSFRELWSLENDERPPAVFGTRGRVTTRISAISFIERDAANVRFTKTLTYPDREPQTIAFNAIVGFRYVQRRMSMTDLWRNPLGFQVVSYRVTREQ